MLARFTAAVRFVGRTLAAQPKGAELVLVAALRVVETGGFLATPSLGHRRAVDVRGARPHRLKTRSCGADVVVHLPARTSAIFLICRTDGLDHSPFDRVAEVGEAVKRRQRVPLPLISLFRLRRSPCDLGFAPSSRRKHGLRVPPAVGGRADERISRVGVERGNHHVEPARRHDGAAFEQHDQIRVGCSGKTVEARGRAYRTFAEQLTVFASLPERRTRISVRRIGDEQDLTRRRRALAHAVECSQHRATSDVNADADCDSTRSSGHGHVSRLTPLRRTKLKRKRRSLELLRTCGHRLSSERLLRP